MGSAITKTEIYKEMQEDVKILKIGSENLKKIMATIEDVQKKVKTSITALEKETSSVTTKVGDVVKKVEDVKGVQTKIEDDVGKLERAAKNALAGQGGAMLKDAEGEAKGFLGGFFSFFKIY